ncbi:MAG: hypothetical protein IKM04_04465 [Clostridia bacterium]|nr:hypothetical protein [Clostridia bacterium]
MYSISVDRSNPDLCFVANVLSEELTKRTGLDFPLSEGGNIVINIDLSLPAEGFSLKSDGTSISIIGGSRLGAIHGVGRLLRLAKWAKGSFSLPAVDITDAPEKEIRGNQLGYRPKTNAYDAWDKATYAQYIREQALFGAGSVEFMPANTDDRPTSPVMKFDQLEMNIFQSQTAKEYGLRVWFWYPNIFKNETGVAIPRSGMTGNAELDALLAREDAARERDFSAIPYIDDIMIPGGDPGELLPPDLFAYSARCADILHKYHPNARVWVSGQIMTPTAEFFRTFMEQALLPHDWLYGMCYAPWMQLLLREFREMLPPSMPIRTYPDICHLCTCQYPVHNWDPVWAVTAGRECYNPRPRAHRRAHELTVGDTSGNLCYSEGIADDVSKHLWLDMDWSRSIPFVQTLRDFASMYISSAHAEEIGSVIADFEEIYNGPAIQNTAAERVWTAIHSLKASLEAEDYMPGFGADSYRFNMALLMADYLRYVHLRAARDAGLYSKALGLCGMGLGGKELIAGMREVLAEIRTSPDKALQSEIWAVADRLFEQIGWQTDTVRHFAQDWGRGGFLDALDLPLCDLYALEYRLDRAEKLDSDAEIYAEIDRIRFRNTTAPGGKYINFGTHDSLRYVTSDLNWHDQPEAIHIPRIEHALGVMAPDLEKDPNLKRHQHLFERVASVLGYYDGRVTLSIDGLLPGVGYELRTVFPLRFGWQGKSTGELPTHVLSEGRELVHLGFDPEDDHIHIYDVPAEQVSAEGILNLEFTKDDGPRGTGVTELWLQPRR